MNVLDKLPKAEQSDPGLRAIWQAESEVAAEAGGRCDRGLPSGGLTGRRTVWGRSGSLPDVLRVSGAALVHLRTTNVIESPFAGVRLRTNAAKRFKETKAACTVHQVLMRLSQNWRHEAAPCAQIPLPEGKNRRVKTKVKAKAKTHAA
ncbi:MAG: hypothetical protein IPM18_02210 [Phycisphaerales bacterium]|nr:hypothetical protein [Phycisphaerales bacterium]